MKKGLIGLLIVSFILVFAVSSMADVVFFGNVNFGVKGATGADMDIGTGGSYFIASGSKTSGPWSAGASYLWLPSTQTAALAITGLFLDSFLKYTGSAFTLTLCPATFAGGVTKNVLFTLGTDTTDGFLGQQIGTRMPNADLPPNPGVKLDIPGANFYLIASKVTAANTYHFGGGISFAATSAVNLGARFNSIGGVGTAYAGQIKFTAGALQLTGEYGATSVNSGFYGKMVWTASGGSSFTLSYGSYNSATIYGAFATPLAPGVTLIISAVGMGSVTTYGVRTGLAF